MPSRGIRDVETSLRVCKEGFLGAVLFLLRPVAWTQSSPGIWSLEQHQMGLSRASIWHLVIQSSEIKNSCKFFIFQFCCVLQALPTFIHEVLLESLQVMLCPKWKGIIAVYAAFRDLMHPASTVAMAVFTGITNFWLSKIVCKAIARTLDEHWQQLDARDFPFELVEIIWPFEQQCWECFVLLADWFPNHRYVYC